MAFFNDVLVKLMSCKCRSTRRGVPSVERVWILHPHRERKKEGRDKERSLTR